MPRKYFDNVDESSMPGVSRTGFEVLARSFDSLIPGFRNMIYRTINDRVFGWDGDSVLIDLHPKDTGLLVSALRVRILHTPVYRGHTYIDDGMRKLDMSMTTGKFPTAENPDSIRSMNLCLSSGPAYDGHGHSFAAKTSRDLSHRATIRRDVHQGSVYDNQALETLVQPKRRAVLDAAIREQFGDETHVKILGDAVRLVQAKMDTR